MGRRVPATSFEGLMFSMFFSLFGTTSTTVRWANAGHPGLTLLFNLFGRLQEPV